jgi:transposase
MRLKDYGRNPKKRKAYVQQPGLLLIGIDISKSKHNACIGTKNGITQRKMTFAHSRKGFQMFEDMIRKSMFTHTCKKTLIGMEPSGIY